MAAADLDRVLDVEAMTRGGIVALTAWAAGSLDLRFSPPVPAPASCAQVFRSCAPQAGEWRVGAVGKAREAAHAGGGGEAGVRAAAAPRRPPVDGRTPWRRSTGRPGSLGDLRNAPTSILVLAALSLTSDPAAEARRLA